MPQNDLGESDYIKGSEVTSAIETLSSIFFEPDPDALYEVLGIDKERYVADLGAFKEKTDALHPLIWEGYSEMLYKLKRPTIYYHIGTRATRKRST